MASTEPRTYEAGRVIGAGSYVCTGCGLAISLAALESVPTCSSCGGTTFRRASLFEQPTVDVPAVKSQPGEPAWLDRARREIRAPGHFLALEPDGSSPPIAIPLPEGWSRIGRSAAADIRLDDPTVSRRHALVVRSGAELSVLDDRSLNGVFVNGEQVDWSPLADGDELAVGRYLLRVLQSHPAGARPGGRGISPER